jgi:integrase
MIYKRGKDKNGRDRYAVRIDLEPDITGKRRRISLGTFSGKKPAEKAERDALHDKDRGIDLAAGTGTVAEMVRRFLQDRETRCTRTTMRNYNMLARRYILPHLGAKVVAKVKAVHITEWKSTLRTHGGHNGKPLGLTAVHAFRCARTIWEWGIKQGHAQVNPLRAVDSPKVPRRDAKVYSAEQIGRLLLAADATRWGPFIRLALATGARRGELCGLEWGDVDFAGRTLRIERSLTEPHDGGELKSPKNERTRTIDLSPAAIDALERQRLRAAEDRFRTEAAYCDDSRRPVFTDEIGRRVMPRHATEAFEMIRKRAEVKGTLHGLRHAAASYLLGSGTDLRTVQELLGHADPTTTLRVYAHVMPRAHRTAVDRLGTLLNSGNEE